MEKITSVHNSKISDISKLKNSKYRKQSGLFFVEGKKLVCELIRSGIEPVYCFISENSAKCIPHEIDKNIIYEVTESVMHKISEMHTPQDMIVVAKLPERVESETCGEFILALDRIQDPSNIGSILRSAEAFGIKDIVLSENCCDPYCSKALRGAMGSTFRLNIITLNLEVFLKNKKACGYTVIGTGLNKNFTNVSSLCSYKKKILVIGNEGSGVSKSIQAQCDIGMYIPMTGKNESLNAAVAASVIMWENQRQNEQ